MRRGREREKAAAFNVQRAQRRVRHEWRGFRALLVWVQDSSSNQVSSQVLLGSGCVFRGLSLKLLIQRSTAAGVASRALVVSAD